MIIRSEQVRPGDRITDPDTNKGGKVMAVAGCATQPGYVHLEFENNQNTDDEHQMPGRVWCIISVAELMLVSRQHRAADRERERFVVDRKARKAKPKLFGPLRVRQGRESDD